MIELKNVSKSFSDLKVLKRINIKIESGETFVIIGRSGTGKTVTLRHISGLEEPDSGNVYINGVEMSGATNRVKHELRQKMGIVFQSGGLINWMTVRENIALPLVEARKHHRDEIDDIVNEKLKLMKLENAGNKMPADISGGMKKRASLARVLVRNPDIILYDEPTSGLDPIISRRINDLIIQMQEDFKVTSVVVTHDMHSAYAIADRIAMLYLGKIVQCDVPKVIKNSKNPIVRQFVEGRREGPINVA